MKIILILLGLASLLGGIAMVFMFWPDVVILFKGVGGMLLAVFGLICLFLSQELGQD